MTIPLLNQRGLRIIGALMVTLFSALFLLGCVCDGDTRHGMQVAALACFVLAGWCASWAFDFLWQAECMDKRDAIEAELNATVEVDRVRRGEYGDWFQEAKANLLGPDAKLKCRHCGNVIPSRFNCAGIEVDACHKCINAKMEARRCVICDQPSSDGSPYFCGDYHWPLNDT